MIRRLNANLRINKAGAVDVGRQAQRRVSDHLANAADPELQEVLRPLVERACGAAAHAIKKVNDSICGSQPDLATHGDGPCHHIN